MEIVIRDRSAAWMASIGMLLLIATLVLHVSDSLNGYDWWHIKIYPIFMSGFVISTAIIRLKSRIILDPESLRIIFPRGERVLERNSIASVANTFHLKFVTVNGDSVDGRISISRKSATEINKWLGNK